MPTLTPNLLTAPPAQTSGKATVNNSKPDDAPEQAFGSVLARQLEPAQSAAEPSTSLKIGKKILASESTQDSNTAAPANDPTANLIAMLQAPVELRTPTGLVAQADNVKADGKAPLLGLAEQLAGKTDKADVAAGKPLAKATEERSLGAIATERPGNVATNDKANGTTPVAQLQAVIDPAKVSELKAVIAADVQAAAPRAQDVAAFTAPALSAVPPSVQNASGTPATIATPMGSSVWADDFAQQVTWMATGKQDQTASLHLNPPDLGPMQVVVKVSDSQATVLFTSPHGAVREAIENAMPKLREMMADNGITLSNTSVSDQAPRERSDANDNGGTRRDTWSSGESMDDSVRTGSVQSVVARQKGMVDTFA